MTPSRPVEASTLLRWYGLARSFDPRLSTVGLIRDPARTLRYARKALRGIRRYGRLLESVSGTISRPPFRHYWGLFRRFGHTIEEYYRYRLHDVAGDLEAAAFLSERRLANLCEGGYAYLGVHPRGLLDKARFADTCRQHRLPAIPSIAEIEQGRVIWGPGSSDQGLPPADLITKPSHLKCGTDVSLWRWDAGAYTGSSGVRCSADSLIERLREDSRKTKMMVQPRVENPEPLASLTGGGLCTFRILTSRPIDGPPQLQSAVLKMPTGSNVADNFAANGIAAPVDIESGTIGLAVSKSVEGMVRGESFARHPDTGEPIAGLRLSAWEEVRDLCVEAHRCFAECHSIGWDAALTTDGPVLVEGNHDWDSIVVQQPGLSPLGKTGLIDHVLSFFGSVRHDHSHRRVRPDRHT